jgi:2,3-bisphosphoglycerate-dependent phosphoglycerate mutase
MTRVVAAILRHGDYEQPAGVPSAFLPHPLTDLGRQQSVKAAGVLTEFAASEELEIDRVVDTSRMLRAWETGKLIADAMEPPCEVEEFDALAERCVGAAANLTIDEIAEVIERDPRYPSLPDGWKATADFRLPLQGAENLREAGERVAAHIEQRMNNLRRSAANDVMKVFVGHGAAFRYAAVKLGLLADSDAPRLSMFHCVPVFLEKMESGEWRHIGGDWKVRAQHKTAMD